jgi:dolichol-phosphate mannosyltransferase
MESEGVSRTLTGSCALLSPQPSRPMDALTADLTSAADWPAGRVLVVMATFNERDNVCPLMEAILTADERVQVLVVDDDSPDGTGQLALDTAARHQRAHVLIRRGRRGLGSAILEGFEIAAARGFEVAFNMDADFSHDPADLPRLLAALEPIGGRPLDLVIGSRRVSGGRVVGWPLSRHISSRLVGWFTRLILRVPVRDGSSGYRCLRLAILPRLSPRPMCTGYAFHEDLVWRVHRAGGRLMEVPICFTDRARGRSKANLSAMLEGIRDLLRLAWWNLR